MATGKERGYKDWNGSKEFRRSARNYSESDAIPHRKNSGNKRWCKKRKGLEHIWEQTGVYFFPYAHSETMTHELDYWRFLYKCKRCTVTKTEKKFRVN